MNPEQTRSQKAKSSFSADDFAKALEEHSYEFRRGQVVRGKIDFYDNEGAYIDIGGKSAAFLPLGEASSKQVTNLSEVLPLGEERDFLIIREQNEDGQVTLSIRQLELKQAWDRLTEVQNNNQSIEVRVTGINKGGVTVDVEGLRGFIPRSHLIERDNLASLIGQNLVANFLEVDRERNKMVLSQRQIAQSSRMSQLEVGQLVEGAIVSIKPFGVFVDLDGLTALLHINQVSKNYVESLTSLFHMGQMIKAIVINIDEGKSRVSLSTKVLENYPGEMIEKMNEVMDSAEARRNKISKTLSV